MAFYTDLHKRCHGLHVFDAAALDVLAKYQPVEKPVDTADGVVVDLIDQDTKQALCTDILIHNNGRKAAQPEEKPATDLALDTLWFKTEQLAAMPDAVQDALYPYEQIPGPTGRRDPRDGLPVIEPRPIEAAFIEARKVGNGL